MTGSRITSSPLPDKLDQERFLPIANVGRIMKKALPANAKISKEAKEMVQECVSEFISFVTGEASDKCHKEKRKTVNGDDLLWAMTTLGFDNYVGPLKQYLSKYRDSEGDQKNDCDDIGGAKFTARPAFLLGFDGGNYHDHGGVVSGYSRPPGFEFDGNNHHEG